MKHARAIIFSTLVIATPLLFQPHARAADSEEIVIDAVAASVNGAPITLRELCLRLTPPRRLSLKEASADPEARQVLDAMIMERVIADEAEAKKIGVSDEEIAQYLMEIAARNGLDLPGLEDALVKEGRNVEDYKRQIKMDILKSKLAASFAKGGIGVTKKEVEEFLEQHPEMTRGGAKVKLRQIFVSAEGRGEDAAREILERVKERLESGEEFEKLAMEVSESPDAREGGLLDEMAEKDMHPKLFEALLPLDEGEVSEIASLGAGFHIFKLEERISEEQNDHDRVFAEAEKIIRQRKTESRMATFFGDELLKQHSVDKKI